MESDPSREPWQILVIEDNLSDVRLMREAFRATATEKRVNFVSDGEQAMCYLRRKSPFDAAVRPDLVLLDLNLPRKDGREVLAEIKTDPDLVTIPVVVLSISAHESEVEMVYRRHGNSFFAKPMDLNQFMRTIQQIDEFWFAGAVLPPRKGNPQDSCN